LNEIFRSWLKSNSTFHPLVTDTGIKTSKLFYKYISIKSPHPKKFAQCVELLAEHEKAPTFSHRQCKYVSFLFCLCKYISYYTEHSPTRLTIHIMSRFIRYKP